MSVKNFEKITASPEALANFLDGLDAVGAPWETEFHRTFCEKCEAETRSPYCDAENCPHDEMRDDPLWWLGLDVEVEEPKLKQLIVIPTAAENETVLHEPADEDGFFPFFGEAALPQIASQRIACTEGKQLLCVQLPDKTFIQEEGIHCLNTSFPLSEVVRGKIINGEVLIVAKMAY